jgi:hypothetical protein
LRQSWQPKDVSNHERALGILRANVADDEDGAHTRQLLDELDDRFASARAETLMQFVDPEDLKRSGTPGSRMPRVVKELTADQVLDDWLHGCVVHGDPAKALAVALWPRPSHEWSVIKAERDHARRARDACRDSRRAWRTARRPPDRKRPGCDGDVRLGGQGRGGSSSGG